MLADSDSEGQEGTATKLVASRGSVDLANASNIQSPPDFSKLTRQVDAIGRIRTADKVIANLLWNPVPTSHTPSRRGG